jgi:hypothetical protein
VSRPGLAAMMRLIRASETWAIEFHPQVPCWSAERCEGTAIRYVFGDTTAGLAARIDAAERRAGR